MTTVTELEALPIHAVDFQRFGRVVNLAASGPEVVEDHGAEWTDRHTRGPLLDLPGRLGITTGPPLTSPLTAMERHTHTREALFCLAESVVLAVAPADLDVPIGSEVVAVVIRPGDVVVLDEGVWHGPCWGLHGPTPYYWYAAVDDSRVTVWEPIVDGPIRVHADGGDGR